MNDCIFCKIIEGEIPSHKVYEDENTIAFLDTNPTSKGHTLVVPKKHVETIDQASGMDYMWNSLVKVSQAVEEAFNPEGLNISQNNGEVAGQEVMHMHFHITPRYTGDEIEVNYTREELEDGEKIAEKITSTIREP
ncbi:MAG: HIT family protein [Candidatus Nanohaloarchaea archaeon]